MESCPRFEAYTHFYTIRRYLDTVGYRPVTDAEVAALREKDLHVVYANETRELVNFMATEHFASRFFSDLAQRADEPVLIAMLKRMSAEEVVHAHFAYDLLAARLQDGRITKEDILVHAKGFRHVGGYVLPKVSNVEEDNVQVIMGFGEMIEELTGTALTDFMALA